MNQKHAALALAIAAALAASPALAADKRSSVSVFGNVTVPDVGDNSGSLFVSYGYLLTDSLELEGGIGQFFSGGITATTLTVGAQYYFGSLGAAGSVVPYVKANLGRSSSSGGGSSANTFGGGGGVEFALSESASAFVEGVYQEVKITNFNTSQFSIQLGLKLRF